MLHSRRHDASQIENVPATAAVTATRYRTSAVPSLTRLSPSTIETVRRGTPSRRMIAVAAIGSVGETTAPRTKAAVHDMSSTRACATTATATIVVSTSPIESETDRTDVRSKLAQRREERRGIEERRQDRDEDERRRELHGRNARNEAERKPAEDEENRIRDA